MMASSSSPPQLASPADKNPLTRPLRRGDLVRVSEAGILKAKRFKDRDGSLGRVAKVHEIVDQRGTSYRYDVEWILDTGKLVACEREDLFYTTADAEGLTQEVHRRHKRKPLDFMQELAVAETAKKQRKEQKKAAASAAKKPAAESKKKAPKGASLKKAATAKKVPKAAVKKASTAKKAPKAAAPPAKKTASKAKPAPKNKPSTAAPKKSEKGGVSSKKRKSAEPEPVEPNSAANGLDLYERQRREFERIFTRLEDKVDYYRHFWGEAPPEFDEQYGDADTTTTTATNGGADTSTAAAGTTKSPAVSVLESATTDVQDAPVGGAEPNATAAAAVAPGTTDNPSISVSTSTTAATNEAPVNDDCNNNSAAITAKSSANNDPYPPHAPYNWEMIRRRMKNGRYVLDRIKKEEDERFELFGPYYDSLGKEKPRRRNVDSVSTDTEDRRVVCRIGVDWDLFRQDVFAMVDAALVRPRPEDEEEDDGQKGSLSYAVKKVKEALEQVVERTGKRHTSEMDFADDRHKFAFAVQKSNKEAAMQSWRKIPFPERKYERLEADVVCAGLSTVDEKIASYELQTSLPDSFIGQAYRYDDTGQSEAWMKSVVDETGPSAKKSKKKDATDRKADEKRQAALALSADEGVTRAQVTATMQSLLIAVQDKVMTENDVLRQSELHSANWVADSTPVDDVSAEAKTDGDNNVNERRHRHHSTDRTMAPDIVEQPVWGIDCYTRRNILSCLCIEFDAKTALLFIEKWLLPAINACPEDLAHNLSNAARILEGLPFEDDVTAGEGRQEDPASSGVRATEEWRQSLLGRALIEKIATSGPPWLHAAANQLRRARSALGPDFFRVHPKGHGSIVVSSNLKANSLVTFYRGELYPSWRWGEKMDAIEITQNRKDLKPALPDFYNMALERPQLDPRGYGLLFVDASRKAGHGSSLSHSCAPTCEVRVAAFNGELCLAMTTLRALEMGEELTFDYNAVTESLNEYRSAVCLCGYGRCRGSFLHFATADCYQQVLNRNSPIATRFASLVKGSMKQVMSQDDEQVLKNHGFLTAAFGAIGVNRRQTAGDGHGEVLVDSLAMIPVWLRTYVADTLRYIEYERRALPIALICDHISSSREDDEEEESLPSHPTKAPGPEPAFFYFSRTESAFIKGLVWQEGFPESLTGLQLKHTMQRVASSYWFALPEEKRQLWKEKARANHERKLTAWRAAQKIQQSNTGKGKKKEKAKSKPAIDDILHSSNISFQDADAEGVAAMEQRIQQLTQSLSRVGRVLDRHREASFDSAAEETSSPQDRAPSPLRILADEEVVGWIWNSSDGVVPALIRAAEGSRCVRPQLLQAFRNVRRQYSSLEACRDPSSRSSDVAVCQASAGKRRQLTEALLQLRASILTELKEMAKEFRQHRSAQTNKQNNDVNISQPPSELSSVADADAEEDEADADEMPVAESDSVEPCPTTTDAAAQAEEEGVGTSVPTPSSSNTVELVTSLLDGLVDAVDKKSPTSGSAPEVCREESQSGKAGSIDKGDSSIESSPWLNFYGERHVLHAVADLLLLYAHTNNFFVLQPYRALQSTPIEVYARELGNAVPLSAIDVGLKEDGSEPTTVAVGLTPVKEAPDQASTATEPLSQERKPSSTTDLCAPDAIVAKVSVRYQGDYVLSQLLQWYNAGIGQKPGLPDLLGCTVLPSMSDCWSSELLESSKVAAERRTTYERKVRPSLVEWLQDPYQRGNAWPKDIRKAFVAKESGQAQQDMSDQFRPFGSPIIDFLVTGDESNISEVLNALDGDDKVASKKSGHGLLSSVDKGRPAQAVSTWVQCENPECMKWRKIPWHVDSDLLPEKFFCTDNKWNPDANDCSAPEDDWDEADTLVGADGKVEGSPLKKKDEERLSVQDESSFTIGTRFDVQRSKKSKFSIATVRLVDFSGSVKRILFHFTKTSSERDEWVEFGSPRIAPLYSKVPRKISKSKSKTESIPGAVTKGSAAVTMASCGQEKASKPVKKKLKATPASDDPLKAAHGIKKAVNPAKKKKKKKKAAPVSDNPLKQAHGEKEAAKPAKITKPTPVSDDPMKPSDEEMKALKPALKKIKATPTPVDPSNEESFTVGARFDVFRQGKEAKPRYYSALVKELDSTGSVLKILFHYTKTNVKYDEWIEFGSPRICAFNSKVPFQEKKARKKRAKDLEAALGVPPGATVDPTTRTDPSGDSTFAPREAVTDESGMSSAVNLGSWQKYGMPSISSDVIVEERPRSRFGNGTTDASFLGSFARQAEESHRVERPFVEDSREAGHSDDAVSRQQLQPGSWTNNSYGASVFSQSSALAENPTTRPPSFTTFRSDPMSYSAPVSVVCAQRSNLYGGFGQMPESQPPIAPSPAPSATNTNMGLSGLDMLAAVTSHGAFATLLTQAPKPPAGAQADRTSAFAQANNVQAYAERQNQPDMRQAQALALLQSLGMQQPRDPSFFYENHSER